MVRNDNTPNSADSAGPNWRVGAATLQTAFDAGPAIATPPRSGEAVWGFSAQIAATIVQTAATLPLTRLLTPSEYGQFAWILTIVTFIALATDACTQSAVTRAPDITRREVGTYWLTAVICGGCGGLVLFFLAIPIAAVIPHALPDMADQLRLGALTIVVMAAQHVPRGLLIRGGKLATIAVIDFLSTLTAAGAAIVVALVTRSAWALVLHFFLTAAMRYVAYAFAARYAPWKAQWQLSTIRQLLRFATGFWVFNIVNFAARNLDNVIVGHVMGPHALGIYSRSFALLLMPLVQVQGGLGSYGLRVLAHLQEQRSELKAKFLRLLTLVQVVAFPLAAALAVAAEPVVLTMFGRQWLSAVPLVQAFAVAGAVQAAAMPVFWLVLALGQNHRLVWLGAANATPLVAVAGGAIAHNLVLLSIGYAVICGILVQGIAVYVAASTSIVRTSDILGPAVKRAAAAALSAAPAIGLSSVTTDCWPILRLLISGTTVLSCYTVLLRSMDSSGYRLLDELRDRALSAVRSR